MSEKLVKLKSKVLSSSESEKKESEDLTDVHEIKFAIGQDFEAKTSFSIDFLLGNAQKLKSESLLENTKISSETPAIIFSIKCINAIETKTTLELALNEAIDFVKMMIPEPEALKFVESVKINVFSKDNDSLLIVITSNEPLIESFAGKIVDTAKTFLKSFSAVFGIKLQTVMDLTSVMNQKNEKIAKYMESNLGFSFDVLLKTSTGIFDNLKELAKKNVNGKLAKIPAGGNTYQKQSQLKDVSLSATLFSLLFLIKSSKLEFKLRKPQSETGLQTLGSNPVIEDNLKLIQSQFGMVIGSTLQSMPVFDTLVQLAKNSFKAEASLFVQIPNLGVNIQFKTDGIKSLFDFLTANP